MFDRSLLPPALCEFVVVADTHYMLPPQGGVEFSSRRKQTDRAQVALAQIASLADEIPVVHMGDLVQEFPETSAFAECMTGALRQLSDLGIKPLFVAGNHDVGDKPDGTMPTRPVTAESLMNHHNTLGRSWQSCDVGPCHLVVLNSQILNTDLPEAAEQVAWLEEDLTNHSDKRTFVFIHLRKHFSNLINIFFRLSHLF